MIFLDANFLMSLFIRTEEHHDIATKIYEKIKNQRLIISNSIILEVMTVSNTKIKVSKEILEDKSIPWKLIDFLILIIIEDV